MTYKEFIYTPITEEEGSGNTKLRKVYIITENDTYIEGYDISVLDDEDLRNIDHIKETLENAKPERIKEYALYFRRFLKKRISLSNLKEIKETLI